MLKKKYLRFVKLRRNIGGRWRLQLNKHLYSAKFVGIASIRIKKYTPSYDIFSSLLKVSRT